MRVPKQTMAMETITEFSDNTSGGLPTNGNPTSNHDSPFGDSDGPINNQHWTRRAFRGRRSVRYKSDGDTPRKILRSCSVRVAKSSPSVERTLSVTERAPFLDDMDIQAYQDGKGVFCFIIISFLLLITSSFSYAMYMLLTFCLFVRQGLHDLILKIS